MKKLDHLEHLKEIVDRSLPGLDLTEGQKEQVRQRAAGTAIPKKKKYWLAPLPAIAAAILVAVLVPITQHNTSQVIANSQNPTEDFHYIDLIALARSNTASERIAEEPPSKEQEFLASSPAGGDIAFAQPPSSSSESVKNWDWVTSVYRETANFSLDLFRESVHSGENSVISPLSAWLSLGMAAKGAEGSTLTEFLDVMVGGLPITDMKSIHTGHHNLLFFTNGKQCVIQLANSVWLQDGFAVKRGFLADNENIWEAGIYQIDFSDPAASDAINQWVSKRTGGKITEMVENMDPKTMMYLINTLYVEMDWETPFEAYRTRDEDFHTADGQTVSASFMGGEDGFYINGKNVQGIKKPYANEHYSFLALLPDEGISLDEYISTLTGEDFLALSLQQESDPLPVDSPGPYTDGFPEEMSQEQQNKILRDISYRLPKFQYSYSLSFKEALQNMGLKEAFTDSADFSNLSDQKVYIEDVLQKTFIEVDELGTKAGASTGIEIGDTGGSGRTLEFNRPFLYAIIDNNSGLPLFLGTVANPSV